MNTYPHDPLLKFAQGKPIPKALQRELERDGYITSADDTNPARLSVHGAEHLKNTP